MNKIKSENPTGRMVIRELDGIVKHIYKVHNKMGKKLGNEASRSAIISFLDGFITHWGRTNNY